MQRLARFCVRNRWWVVGTWIAIIAGTTVIAGAAGGADYRNEFTLPGTETDAVATLFGVSRALWSSQSTLLVYLSSASADPMNDICPLLEQYPELAASRVQLQPPDGSDKPVRFTHCRTY